MDWITPVASGVAGLVVLSLTYLGAKRLGLTDLQKAVRTETEALVNRLKDQVSALERDNSALRARVAELESSERSLKARVDALEQAIADRAIAQRRRT